MPLFRPLVSIWLISFHVYSTVRHTMLTTSAVQCVTVIMHEKHLIMIYGRQ